MIKKKPKRIMLFLLGGLISSTFWMCSENPDLPKPTEGFSEPIHESIYSTPFPLTRRGEKIDILVWVPKEGAYYFSLVAVEKDDWSEEKKKRTFEIFHVYGYPYLIKLRFQLDSADDRTNVHIDKIVLEGSPEYFDSPTKDITWMANEIDFSMLKPGAYRVRVQNLKPVPEIDFETLFQFRRNNRKY